MDISINMAMDTVMVNDAMVILANLTADNGVVHVIDKVLLPPTPDNLDEVVSNWSVMPNPANEFIVLNGWHPKRASRWSTSRGGLYASLPKARPCCLWVTCREERTC